MKNLRTKALEKKKGTGAELVKLGLKKSSLANKDFFPFYSKGARDQFRKSIKSYK